MKMDTSSPNDPINAIGESPNNVVPPDMSPNPLAFLITVQVITTRKGWGITLSTLIHPKLNNT